TPIEKEKAETLEARPKPSVRPAMLSIFHALQSTEMERSHDSAMYARISASEALRSCLRSSAPPPPTIPEASIEPGKPANDAELRRAPRPSVFSVPQPVIPRAVLR